MGSIILSAMIISMILYVVADRIHPLPRVFYVPTDSMESTIRTHSFIYAVPVSGDSLEIGEIYVYECMVEPDLVFLPEIRLRIVHRLMAINGDVLTFQGDNEKLPDEPVKADQVRYRVTAIFP